MGEFNPIAECAAGGNDGILEGNRADRNSEVDFFRPQAVARKEPALSDSLANSLARIALD